MAVQNPQHTLVLHLDVLGTVPYVNKFSSACWACAKKLPAHAKQRLHFLVHTEGVFKLFTLIVGLKNFSKNLVTLKYSQVDNWN
jgi:hypothetical protein